MDLPQKNLWGLLVRDILQAKCPSYHPTNSVKGDSSLVRRVIYPKCHLSEMYRHRVRIRVRISVRVRVRVRLELGLGFASNFESAQLHYGQMTLRTSDL